jgi:hypothetical protein
MRWFRKLFELFQVQDGPRDFQGFALEATKVLNPFVNPFFSVSKKIPSNNGTPPLNNTL